MLIILSRRIAAKRVVLGRHGGGCGVTRIQHPEFLCPCMGRNDPPVKRGRMMMEGREGELQEWSSLLSGGNRVRIH